MPRKSAPYACRTLHFAKIEEAMADADQLAAAERDGKLERAGNWTPGQIFNHVATWIDYAYDGTPLKIPFFIKFVARPFKNRFLYKPMRPGSKIPRVPNGTLATDVVPTEEALEHLRRAFTRLQSEAPAAPHPALGKLTHDEWKNLHLRNSELHFSFLKRI
jgi:hypothetical protein